jgi:endonuclease/exonuclease/phosphatase family metal-dependent hydrolase
VIPRFILALLLFNLTFGEEGVGKTWKVATWNLQNYLVQNRYEDAQFRFSYPMPEDRKWRIRKLILSEKPDILFLQEVGNAAFLLELQMDLKAEGLEYPFFQFSGIPDARSGLGFLSRIAPVECIFHNISLKRGLQELRVELGDAQYRFFHVHLKSRYTDNSSDPQSSLVRELEINSLGTFVKSMSLADSSSRFIITGDFNTPFDDPLLISFRDVFSPVPCFDLSGEPYTYFHKSGNKEILDGFWIPLSAHPTPVIGSLVLPVSNACPSDHRMVVLFL